MFKKILSILYFIFISVLPAFGQVRQSDLNITIGYDKIIELDFTPSENAKITKDNLVSAKVLSEQRKIILKGQKEGATTLTVADKLGEIKARYFLKIVLPDELTPKKECELGNYAACIELGNLYKVAGRLAEANFYYIKACEEDVGNACYLHAELEESLGNFNEAIKIFQKACESKNTAACSLFKSDQELWDLTLKFLKDNSLLVTKCDQGEMNACFSMGLIEFNKAEFLKAKPFFEKACLGKLTKACDLFDQLKLTEKDFALNLKQCNENQFKSCFILGLYYNSFNKITDTRIYLNKACLGKVPEGCLELARFEIKNKHYEEGKKIYAQECENNNYPTCRALALLEINNDTEEAKKYFKKSCEGKLLDSCDTYKLLSELEEKTSNAKLKCEARKYKDCLDLAIAYKGKKFLAEARKYYKIACSVDLFEACQALSEIEINLGNEVEAKRIFFTPCENGQVKACRILANMNKKQGNLAEAKRAYKKACENQDFISCFAAGNIELQQDKKDEAQNSLQLACKGKIIEACELIQKKFPPAKPTETNPPKTP